MRSPIVPSVRGDRQARARPADLDCGCRPAIDATRAIASLSGAPFLQTITDDIDPTRAPALIDGKLHDGG